MQHHSLWAKCASNTFRKLRKHRKRFFLLWSLIRRPKKNTFTGSKTTQNWLFSSHLYIFQTIIDRGLGTGRFPVLIGPTSPITPQTMLDACIQNSFRVSICTGWGEGITARKFRKGCTVLWRNTEWRKNMNIALLSQEVLSMTVVSAEDVLFF